MRIITMICWIVSAFVLVGVAVWFLTGTMFGIRSEKWDNEGWGLKMLSNINIGGWEILTGPYESAGTYTQEAAGIDSLKIDWISGEVTVKPYDGDDFKITEFAQRTLGANEKLRISVSGGMLTIKFIESGRVLRMPQKKLEVLVPRSLSENLNELNVDNTSGGVIVESITAETIRANSMSGGIQIDNTDSTVLDVDSTSGSLTLKSAYARDMKLNSMSGGVRVSGSTAKNLNCDTVSGRINVSGVFDSSKLSSMSGGITFDNASPESTLNANSTSGSLELSGSFIKVDAESMSGSVTIKSSIVPGFVAANTTSGRITVAIPDEGEISVYHSTVSGRFSSDIPIRVQGRGAQFELSSMSGSIKIIRNSD